MHAAHTRDPKSVYVFNCALGRGRTTTGLTIACLTWRAIAHDTQLASWDLSNVRMLPLAVACGGQPPHLSEAAHFGWGEYAAVVELVALLPSGCERKAFVDCVIDHNAHMQNLRKDILPKKQDAEKCATARARALGCTPQLRA